MPAQEPNDLDAAVDALYARPLDEFIAARDAVVRQTMDNGDRLGAQRVKRLPKPSVAAWVVNHVAREHPEEIAALADLGDELRAATRDRDRGRIRALDHLRRERTDTLVRTVREAGEVGGRTVSSAVLDRLTETLTAAVMDPDAAAVLRAGRLSRALQHVGFGIVDEQGEEADLVALHPATSDTDAAPDAAAPGAESARRSDDSAAAGLAEAERAVEEASAQVDGLEARRDDLRERLRNADAAIERGESEVERLDNELERLTAERDTVRRALDKARDAADEARADLTVVEDDLDDAVERSAEARRRRREARGR